MSRRRTDRWRVMTKLIVFFFPRSCECSSNSPGNEFLVALCSRNVLSVAMSTQNVLSVAMSTQNALNNSSPRNMNFRILLNEKTRVQYRSSNQRVFKRRTINVCLCYPSQRAKGVRQHSSNKVRHCVYNSLNKCCCVTVSNWSQLSEFCCSPDVISHAPPRLQK